MPLSRTSFTARGVRRQGRPMSRIGSGARGVSSADVSDVQKSALIVQLFLCWIPETSLMIASAQISIYQLRQDQLGPAVEMVRTALAAQGRAGGRRNDTVVVGEDRIIFAALAEAFARAGETGEVVMTVTSRMPARSRLTAAPTCLSPLIGQAAGSSVPILLQTGVQARSARLPKPWSSDLFIARQARLGAVLCSMWAAATAR